MMKTILWVGPHTPQSSSIRNHLQSAEVVASHSVVFMEKEIPNLVPDVILGENFEDLLQVSFHFPHIQQIYLCSVEDFWSSLRSGVRPLHRFYFLLKQQTLENFKQLLSLPPRQPHKGITRLDKEKKLKSYGTLPAMKNSLGVLKKINSDQLLKLNQFAQNEEERRKKFESLIHLARSLSMSRDIEEVVQYLWSDLRSIQGIKDISFLIEYKKHSFQQIISRSGKFHFEAMTIQTPNHRDFLKSFFQSTLDKGLQVLNSHQLESLSFLQKKSFKKLLSYSLVGEELSKPFILLMDVQEKWSPDSHFEAHLQERLSFIKLTLEKYLLQEEIQTRTNLWASTFDDLNDPLSIITDKQHIVRANHRFLTLMENEVETKNSLWNHLPLDYHDIYTTELHVKNKIYRIRIFPIQDSNNPIPKAFITHSVEVTAERTLYSRLLQSEKMIAVGALAVDLTNALTSPLNTIHQKSLQGLGFEKLSPQTQNDLNEINKASLRSLKIITDFTNFSEGKLEKRIIEAETVVETTIPLIKSLIHGHRFHLKLSEQRHLVYVSSSLLQQVLYNLLRNAHQSMKTPGLLQITSESKILKDMDGVQIAVIDSGSGVPEEFRSKLFQPLVSNKGADGTGLGLNIVKQIVENHRGVVGYEPQKDIGSKFWIWLPVEKKSAP